MLPVGLANGKTGMFFPVNSLKKKHGMLLSLNLWGATYNKQTERQFSSSNILNYSSFCSNIKIWSSLSGKMQFYTLNWSRC
jgi:hypothetical protein